MPAWFDTLLDLLRGAGFGGLLLAAYLLLRDHRGAIAGRLGAVFALSVAAYLVCPLFAIRWQIGWPALPLYLVCFSVAGWFWLFSRAWFVDDFRLRWWHGALVAGLVALYLWRYFGPVGGAMPISGLPVERALHLAARTAALAFVLAALGQALVGRSEDLVETRRRLRAWFVFVIGGHMALVVLAEVSMPGTPPLPVAEAVNLLAIAVEAGAFVAVALRLGPSLFPTRAPAASATQEPNQREAADTDAELIAAIERFMSEQQGYRRTGLTIGGLAAALGVPEYRVRRAINRRLGHRNFPQFLNAHRIAEAQRWLADPAKARVPILIIALDLGYNSIGPFNRAFKGATGLTPAEFRARALGKSVADS